MKKAAKIFAIIIGLVLLLILAVYIVGSVRYANTFEVDLKDFDISTDEQTLARGEYLVQAVAHCGYCHGPDLSGKIIIDSPPEGIVVAPNLTSGEGGIGADYAAEDWVRAIYHGVLPESRSVVMMPSLFFNRLSEQDLIAVIAYLETIPPVDNVLPETNVGPMVKILIGLGPFLEAMSAYQIDHDADFETSPPEGETAEYGEYLVTIAQCSACHGPELAGGQVSPSAPFGPNLTPGGELRDWSRSDFLNTIRTGTHPGGVPINPYMPWEFFRSMTDIDLTAIWNYLQTLPALETQRP